MLTASGGTIGDKMGGHAANQKCFVICRVGVEFARVLPIERDSSSEV